MPKINSKKSLKALITTVPFGKICSTPIDLLKNANIDFTINPINRRLTENELVEMVGAFDVLIAGTEPITANVIEKAKNLKLISRVGIGLDNVDLLAARGQQIKVSYTPDAPSPAVAELTIGLIFSLLRSIHVSNLKMHEGKWERYLGSRLSNSKVGIIGVGRVGKLVASSLSSLGAKAILLNDVEPSFDLDNLSAASWVSKKEIYSEADVITFHVPLTRETDGMIGRSELLMMKKNASLINTCRGGIIQERELAKALDNGTVSGAAIDVYSVEPYYGELKEHERCLLTCHMGSMSSDCRLAMEVEAVEEVVRFAAGLELVGTVPEAEYSFRQHSK